MSDFDFDSILDENTFQPYTSSPESIRSALSEESSYFPSSSSDEVQFSDHLLENIVKVEKDIVETQDSSNPKKRLRTTFTDDQILELEKLFAENHYLCRTKRITTSAKLGLKERQVKVWFQNRRMKIKKLQKKKNEMSNGKNESLFKINDVTMKSNQLTVDEDAKFRRLNTLPGYGSTVHHHHHLPRNFELRTETYDRYFPNAVSYQTAYNGSQQNVNISYIGSYDYSNANTNGYNNNIYCCPTINEINTNHNNYSYYPQPDEKYANYNDYEHYFTDPEMNAHDSNLYATGEYQTSKQNLNFSTKSELSFDLSDVINELCS